MSLLINHAIHDRFGIQPGLLGQLIRIYLDITPGIVEKIHSGVASGDNEQVAQNAHSLKGSSLELGADQLAAICQELQQTAKSGSGDSIPLLAEQLSSCYKETIAALRELDSA